MNITLKQEEIELAISRYLIQTVTMYNPANVKVEFKIERNPSKVSASVDWGLTSDDTGVSHFNKLNENIPEVDSIENTSLEDVEVNTNDIIQTSPIPVKDFDNDETISESTDITPPWEEQEDKELAEAKALLANGPDNAQNHDDMFEIVDESLFNTEENLEDTPLFIDNATIEDAEEDLFADVNTET